MTDQICLSTIRLSNQGLEYLERLRYEDAIFVFTRALGIAKGVVGVPLVAQEEMNTAMKDCWCYDDSESSDSDFCFVEIQLQRLASEDVPCYVFTSPIMIPEESIQRTDRSMSAVKITVIIMFNLALAHHFMAIESNSTDAFERALRLYKLVYQIQMQEDMELCVLHSLALANNVGHVHLALKNTLRSKQCFEDLLATLMYFVEGGECEKDDAMQGFFHNTIPLILTEKVVAAAA
jgi:tetratricopeptide (TPR) repeat protein